MRVRFLLFFSILFAVFFEPVHGQDNSSFNGSIFGIVKDKITSEPLPFTTFELVRASDSSYVDGGMTDSIGGLRLDHIAQGNYFLRISFVGYENYRSSGISITGTSPVVNIGQVQMNPSATQLKGVTIKGKQPVAEMKGDTMQYNANSYKTHPDANAEELITKMPGISSDNGTVKAHGEDVKKVLVDGKPFFGDDPNLALKNIPAEIIDKVQVFDKMSDQAQFTGFDDGNSSKTINIITKPGKNNGIFGKVYSGYGTDGRYIDGGNLNIFKGERRISILGLSNNINQQNFSSQDLLGVSSGGGGGGPAGRMGMGMRGGGPAGGMFGGGGGASSNFLVGSQAGITTTNAAGFNYTDKWGTKIKFNASYFYNQSENTNETSLTRDYFGSVNAGAFYQEKDLNESRNFNHRLNARFEYAMDTMNSLILTPKISFQNNHAPSSSSGSTTLPEDLLLSSILTNSNSRSNGYSFSDNALFQHKFEKKGRTYSVNIQTDENQKTGNGSLLSRSEYYIPSDTAIGIDQVNTLKSDGYTLGAGITYTEPIDTGSQFIVSYNPSFTNTISDKETFSFDNAAKEYSIADTNYSNKFSSTYLVNKGGIGIRKNGKKYNLMAGIAYQYSTLSGQETFPASQTIKKSFSNFLPNAMLTYAFSQGNNLRIFYRTSANAPSISQLQQVVNNSNPLFLSIGNPNLKQDFQHMLITRYGKTQAEKATGFFAFVYFNLAENYIANSTVTARTDTMLFNGILMKRGSQLSQSVNLNGYWNARSLVTYALPVGLLKSNVNFSGGYTFSHTPSLVNEEKAFSDNHNVTGGIGISSNISDKIDFSVNTASSYNSLKSTIQSGGDTHYFSQTSTMKLNLIFGKNIVFNTNLSHSVYTGLSQSYNQNFLIWNGSIAYKLLKNNALEIKGSVSDILNQNNSINRTISETYTEDSQTNALKQYYMLTLTYSIRAFKKPAVGNTK